MTRIMSVMVFAACVVLACAAPSQGGGVYPRMAMESGVYDASPPPIPRDLVVDQDSSGLTVNGSGVSIGTNAASLRGSSSGWVNAGIAPSFGAKATTLNYDHPSASPFKPDRNVANTSGWMLAKFEYTGPATTKSVDLTLTGTAARDTGVADATAYVGGNVELYVPDVAFESSGPFLATTWEEILMLLAPFGQGPTGGMAGVEISDPGGSVLNGSFSFPVTDGMIFYLGMTFGASATYGASDADALTTFQTGFTDPTGIDVVIQEVPGAIPTPLAAAVAIPAMLVMLIRRR